MRLQHNFSEIYKTIESIMHNGIRHKKSRDAILQDICVILKDKICYYDWVGFYLVDQAKGNELVLGPYVGSSTEHVRIPFGHGICGQAAERSETFVVSDVSKESNYLACSPNVKSEIVVPVFKDGKLVAELDIDSNVLGAFNQEDRRFLERVADLVSQLF